MSAGQVLPMQLPSAALGLMPFFPLLGSLAAFLLGKRGLAHLSGPVATGAAAASFLLTVVLFLQLQAGTAFESQLFTWFATGSWNVDFSFRFDQLTAVMCLVITGVGSLIHLYSIAYMHEDESQHRFFCYLNLFMFSMLLLVLGSNLLVLFVGWEGVGLCSYLLIGFWYKNLNYAAAGMKAFVVNRIGDAGFLLGIFLLWNYFGSVDFRDLQTAILSPVAELPLALLTLAAFCFFIGATGKSAQIPLFVWLPDAMAGPTPVSALIHAATMVTAGVYMMARMHFLFDLAPTVQFLVCLVAVATALVAAVTALSQNDIKKVLAYSTVSQLGFMFMAASCGAYWVAVFHLVTHAFFKACLFLGAGSVIHGCHHEQDMRHMGGLAKLMPKTFITYGLSTLAIAGIFPFAGYQSKHAILEAFGSSGVPQIQAAAGWLALLASLTAFLTAFYMTRSFSMTFLGEYRGHAHPHESPWQMTVPLLVLAGLACVGGLILAPQLQGYLSTVLLSTVLATAHAGAEHAHAGIAQQIVSGLLHSWVGLLGVALGLLCYTRLPQLPRAAFALIPPLSRLSFNKFYFDEIYQALVIGPLRRSAGVLWRGADQGIIDGAVNGTASLLEVNGRVAQVLQTGQIRHYAFFMLLGTVLLIGLYLMP